MNENIKAILISLGIVLLVFALVFILGSLLPIIDRGKDLFTAAMPYLTAINVVLILALLYTYVKSYLKLRSGFTIGIILFISCLLMFVVVSNHTMLRMFGFDKGFIFMDIAPMIFSAISLAVLIYISNK
jgi:hypothetical protein